MENERTNPYDDGEGGPKDGQTWLWLDFEKETERLRRDALTNAQRQQEDHNRREIRRRWQAETSSGVDET